MPAPALASFSPLAGTDGSTVSISVPAGVGGLDIITVSIYIEAVVTIDGSAEGFAELSGSPIAASSHRQHVFWKRADAADTGTYDFTLSAAPQYFAAYSERYTGCIVSGTPFDGGLVTATTDATAQTGTPAVSLTTTGPDRLLRWTATNFAGGAWTSPSGFSDFDAQTYEIHGATKAQASAGSTGSLTGSSAGTGQSTAALLALIPAVPPRPPLVSRARLVRAACY